MNGDVNATNPYGMPILLTPRTIRPGDALKMIQFMNPHIYHRIATEVLGMIPIPLEQEEGVPYMQAMEFTAGVERTQEMLAHLQCLANKAVDRLLLLKPNDPERVHKACTLISAALRDAELYIPEFEHLFGVFTYICDKRERSPDDQRA